MICFLACVNIARKTESAFDESTLVFFFFFFFFFSSEGGF